MTVPNRPMGPPACKYSDPGCFESVQDDGGIDKWKNYVLLAQRNLYLFEDDWGYTFPGWFANCGE